jgi:hypothetical protein
MKIQLSNGSETIVDDEDFEFLSQWKWKFLKANGCSGGYACRTIYNKTNKSFGLLLMHRLLNKTEQGMITDHINGDKLDNRKSNLRTVSDVWNMHNRGKNKNNTSGYKGVTFDQFRNRWKASLKFNGKTWQKRYVNKEDAINAVIEKRKEYGIPEK